MPADVSATEQRGLLVPFPSGAEALGITLASEPSANEQAKRADHCSCRGC